MTSRSITRRNLLCGAATTALASCRKHAPASALDTDHGPDVIDAFVAEQMARYRIPGLSLSIVTKGEFSSARSYGLNDLEFGVKATNQTVYQIASVTKIVTSVAVMMLAEDNKLSLDARVTELLPEVPQSWSNIQVHHLLSHTSGLPSNAKSNPRYLAEERLRRERERFIDAEKLDYFTAAEQLSYLSELPLQFAAGTKFSYNQPGYMLLGMIVEHLSGEPFPAFVRHRLFSPLAMSSAQFGDSRVVIANRRQVAYTRQYGPRQNWLWPYSTTDYPAAGLNITAVDMAKLFIAINTGKLLQESTLERMWTPTQLESGKTIKYALGWTVGEIAGRKTVGHEGGGCAWVSHLPSIGFTVIVFSNLAGSGAELGDTLAARLIDAGWIS
jgi:D-alanyl-D-alanine carboxypeptidase